MKTENQKPTPIKGFSKYGIAGDAVINLKTGKKLFCTNDKKYRVYDDKGNRATVHFDDLAGRKTAQKEAAVAESGNKVLSKADKIRSMLEDGKDDAEIAKALSMTEGYVRSVRRFDSRRMI